MQAFLLAGILTFNYLLIGYSQGVFTAQRRFWAFSMSQVVDATVKIILVLILFFLAKISINLALLANIISTAFTLLIIFLRRQVPLNWQFDQGMFHQMYHFAKWTSLSRFFSVFYSKIDILLLNLLASSHEAGIFSAASRVSLLFSLFVSSLSSVLNPRFSSFNTRDKIISYLEKLVFLIAGIAVMMLLAVILAKPIILLTFGLEYQNAIPVFQALTLAMIPFLFTLITTPALVYTYNRPDFYAKTTALQVLSIVILDLTLIPTQKVYAPVIALAVTNIVTLLISSLKLRQLILNDHRS